MSYAKNSIFNDKVVRQMIGKACYTEVAMCAGGIWKPAKLEEKINGEMYLGPSGHFQRMRNGVLPSDKSAEERIHKKLDWSKRKCQIELWRDHPFWKLLSLEPLTYIDTERALMSVRGKVKHRIWYEVPSQDNSSELRYPRLKPEKEDIEKIAEYKNFDALLTLIAFAREAHGTGMLQTYTIAAHHALEIFPDVMIKHPHLYISWKLLASRLKQLIWQPEPSFIFEMRHQVSLPQLRKRINALDELARKQGTPLPPKELIDRYN
jgi:hypothetical protein